MINNAVSRKTMENVRKRRDIKLFTTEKRRNSLVSELNYHTKKIFTENLLAKEIKKAEILTNKLIHLGLSIIELSEIIIMSFIMIM